MSKIDKKISNLKPDSIDLTKEIPVYIEAKEKPKTKEIKDEKTNVEKVKSRRIRRDLLTKEIESLKSNFDEFYLRTKIVNPKYFGPSFLNLVEVLNKNIKELQVSGSFSSYFLRQYNSLKETGKKAKEYIKKINSIFDEARKNGNSKPSTKFANYKIGSIIDLESISGDKLEEEKQNLLYFISEQIEMKGQISNYHPITKVKEELNLAKDCEKNWIIYVETCRQEKQILTNLTIPQIESSVVQENKEQQPLNSSAAPKADNVKQKNKKQNKSKKPKKSKEKNDERILKESIEKKTYKEKNDYITAFETLKISLQRSITTEKFPKEDEEKLEKFLKSWNEKNNDLKKLKGVKYEGATTAKIKNKLKEGVGFFQKLIRKVKGIQSDIDTASSIWSRYMP